MKHAVEKLHEKWLKGDLTQADFNYALMGLPLQWEEGAFNHLFSYPEGEQYEIARGVHRTSLYKGVHAETCIGQWRNMPDGGQVLYAKIAAERDYTEVCRARS